MKTSVDPSAPLLINSIILYLILAVFAFVGATYLVPKAAEVLSDRLQKAASGDVLLNRGNR